MPSVPNSPLNDAHLDQINKGLEALKIAEAQIALAKAAGVDVAAHEKQAQDAKIKLLALKNTYFPGSY